MGSCHRNPSTCKIIPHMVVGTLYLFNSLLTALVTGREHL